VLAISEIVVSAASAGTGTNHYKPLEFQMTVGVRHPTKLKGEQKVAEKARQCLPNAEVTCAVVYVVPDDIQAFYEAPQSILESDGTIQVQRDGDQYRLVID
jgi:hypothetical protein